MMEEFGRLAEEYPGLSIQWKATSGAWVLWPPAQRVTGAVEGILSPLKPDSVSATVSALFKRLKIPKPKGGALHLLRHTLASQMLDSGVPLPVVSQRLGHSSVRVTADIYSHAIHGQDDEAVRRWEEYQQRNRPTKPENWKGNVQ
jgi:integrase